MSAAGASVTRTSVAAPSAASPALQSFDRAWRERCANWGDSHTALQTLRREAMGRFVRLGLPTLRDESWHHSNLRALALRSFHASPADAATLADADIAASWLEGIGAWPVVRMINAIPQPGTLTGAPAGMQVTSLNMMERSDPQRLVAMMLPLSDAEQQRWVLLNTALFEDGLHIRVSGECAVPLLIIHVAAAADAQALMHPRVIIEAAPGSSAVIIEHHVSTSAQPLLSNSVTSVRLANNARLEHMRVFSGSAAATHTDHLQLDAAADAHLRQHTVVLGGGFVRTAIEAHLAAANAALDSYSLLTGHDARHTDCVNIVTHAAPHTRSRQTARIIASGRSRAIFNSKVIVNAGAQKADSLQSCRGLLLSPTAEIDTRPQLEINADDVKCAHGATTGRLDPDMLFYMLARGLDRNAAQSLLVFAFLADALTQISLPTVRAAVESQLIAQLPDSQLLRQFR